MRDVRDASPDGVWVHRTPMDAWHAENDPQAADVDADRWDVDGDARRPPNTRRRDGARDDGGGRARRPRVVETTNDERRSTDVRRVQRRVDVVRRVLERRERAIYVRAEPGV